MHKIFSKKTSNEKKKTVQKKQKHLYPIHTWSDKAFKGTVVNQISSSLPGGPLEIML